MTSNDNQISLAGMEANAGILDYPRKTLPDALWQNPEQELPRLNKDLRDLIINKAKDVLTILGLKLRSVHLYGGAASFQWAEGTDIDVSLYVKWDERGQDPEYVKQLQARFKDFEVPYHNYPIHYFLKGPEDQLATEVADAVYDVLRDRWILPPLILPQGFDPYDYFAPFIREAEKKANAMDEEIGELRRSWTIVKRSQEALRNAKEPEVVQERIAEEKAKIREITEDLVEEFIAIRERRYAMHDKLREKLESGENLERFERFQEPEIVWKYLDNTGYVDLLWAMHKALKAGKLEQALPSTE